MAGEEPGGLAASGDILMAVLWPLILDPRLDAESALKGQFCLVMPTKLKQTNPPEHVETH